jgi:hypothetical protein
MTFVRCLKHNHLQVLEYLHIRKLSTGICGKILTWGSLHQLTIRLITRKLPQKHFHPRAMARNLKTNTFNIQTAIP